MSTKYEVLYGSEIIGMLEVDENRMHKYTPSNEIQKVKDKLVIPTVLTVATNGFVKPIPFFQNRIDAGERIGLTDEIGYQTDRYRLIKV